MPYYHLMKIYFTPREIISLGLIFFFFTVNEKSHYPYGPASRSRLFQQSYLGRPSAARFLELSVNKVYWFSKHYNSKPEKHSESKTSNYYQGCYTVISVISELILQITFL